MKLWDCSDIIKNVTIPEGVSLMLNEEEIKYDMSKYRLYIQLSAATSTVDLKISKGIEVGHIFYFGPKYSNGSKM